MLLFASTPRSVREDEPTVLAIAETLVFTAAALVLAINLGTFAYTAVSAAIAPFLLLRTTRSEETGIFLAESMLKKIPYWLLPPMLFYTVQDITYTILLPVPIRWRIHWYVRARLFLIPAFLSFVLIVLPIVIFSRIAATGINVLLHPFETVLNLSTNWRRNVLCIDVCSIPEVLPGIERTHLPGGVLRGLKLSTGLWAFRRRDTKSWSGMFPIAIVYLTAIPYRWALKSTAVIWSPLIWVFRPLHDQKEIFDVFHRITSKRLYKVGLVYSLIVVFALLSKLYLYMAWNDLAAYWNRIPAVEILNEFVVPKSLPWWQVASGVNAILAWVIFLMADWYLPPPDKKPDAPRELLKLIYNSLTIFRNTLSVYSGACSLYLAIQVGTNSRLPPLGSHLFPWTS